MKSFKEHIVQESFAPRIIGDKIPKALIKDIPKPLQPIVNGFDESDKGIVISFDRKISSTEIKNVEKSLSGNFGQNGYEVYKQYHQYHFTDYSREDY
jgi:hypothetical protein